MHAGLVEALVEDADDGRADESAGHRADAAGKTGAAHHHGGDGVQPVGEMFGSIAYYLQTFKQFPAYSVKEYIDRETNVWEQLQESVVMVVLQNVEIMQFLKWHQFY